MPTKLNNDREIIMKGIIYAFKVEYFTKIKIKVSCNPKNRTQKIPTLKTGYKEHPFFGNFTKKVNIKSDGNQSNGGKR